MSKLHNCLNSILDILVIQVRLIKKKLWEKNKHSSVPCECSLLNYIFGQSPDQQSDNSANKNDIVNNETDHGYNDAQAWVVSHLLACDFWLASILHSALIIKIWLL